MASSTRPSNGRATGTFGSVAVQSRANASWVRSSSRPRAGSGRSGTSSNAALLEEYGERVMPRAAEWESRWWSPIINAEHLAMRDRVGHGRPVGLRDLRHHRARRPRPRPADGRRPDGRPRRPGRLHAAAQRGRRHQVGPHDHAARARPLPGRDRRRARDGRPQVVQRPPACRRLRAAVRRDLDLVHGRRSGARGRATWSPR